MGKTLSAAQMLNAGRRRPPTPAETGTEPLNNVVTSALGDQTSEPLNNVVTSALGDQTSEPLGDQTSEPLGDQTSEPLGDQTSEPLGDQTSEPVNDVVTREVGDKATRPLDDQTSTRRSAQSAVDGHPAATYQRVTVFLTPAQRQWLKLTAKQLPDGLSGSDIVRLAVSRLTLDVTDGLDLVANLTDQAHSDAEVFSGRRNRGLPPRAEVDV